MCREQLLPGSAATSSPNTFPRSVLAKHGDGSFFDDHQSQLASMASDVFSDRECAAHFAATLRTVSGRVENMLRQLNGEDGTSSPSPTRDACRQSLSRTVPLIMEKVSLLVDSVDDESTNGADSSKRVVSKLRATFALVNCVQYLDTIEAGMTYDSRGRFDEVMNSVLKKIRDTPAVDEQFEAASVFRVSHWIAPTLAFDLPAGEVARASVEGGGDADGDSLPFTLQVQPIISFKGEDLITGRKGSSSFRRCNVFIEKCHHKSNVFAEGAGTVGVLDVSLKVSPLDEEAHKPRIWGEKEPDRLCVTNACVVQHNSSPPKPRSHVDLYTSSVYGDASAAARLSIQTYVTDSGEAPQLTVELYVASSSEMQT